MKVSHFDCGHICPCGLGILGKAFSKKNTPSFATRVTLLETSEGPLLIDAGYPRHFLAAPERYPVRWAALRPQAGEEQSAASRLKSMGLNPNDVRHILLTHLDYDHMGGVVDFPKATLHVLESEVLAARSPRLGFEQVRYREFQSLLNFRNLVLVRAFSMPWHGTMTAAPISSLSNQLRFVPLPGHTRGHAGVAYAPHAQGRLSDWTLHAGDAFFDQSELETKASFQVLSSLTSLLHTDSRQAARTLMALRRLQREGLNIECSHDASSFLRSLPGDSQSTLERNQA